MLPPNDDLIFDSWFLDGVLVKVLNFLGGVVGASIHFLRRVLFPSSSVLWWPNIKAGETITQTRIS